MFTYIYISCLFLIYVYIYFFQRNSWTSVWHLIVVCPKISSWYPIHFFNFTTIACPDVSKYLSWMHFGTGLIFGDVWLSHQITVEVSPWPTALMTWIGMMRMMSSVQLGTRKKHVETMSVAEVPGVGLYTHRYFFKKWVLVHVYI